MTSAVSLHHEASAERRNISISSTVPTEVAQCLQNARFLHLATCTNLQPHVSLMNYTYLPTSPYSSSPTIIMTTNPSSKKTLNLLSNPNVSLLVHDWVSHRPPTTIRRGSSDRTGSPPSEATRSSLANLLLNLNTSAISSISATINGSARLVDQGTKEEKYYREQHLENNTFTDEGEEGASQGSFWDEREKQDGGRGFFIEGEEVRVVVVRITDGRVSDWKGAVRDWSLIGESAGEAEGTTGHVVVNGDSSS